MQLFTASMVWSNSLCQHRYRRGHFRQTVSMVCCHTSSTLHRCMLPSFRDTSRVVSPISRSAWANRSICIRRAIRSAEVSPAAFSRAGWTNRTTLPGQHQHDQAGQQVFRQSDLQHPGGWRGHRDQCCHRQIAQRRGNTPEPVRRPSQQTARRHNCHEEGGVLAQRRATRPAPTPSTAPEAGPPAKAKSSTPAEASTRPAEIPAAVT